MSLAFKSWCDSCSAPFTVAEGDYLGRGGYRGRAKCSGCGDYSSSRAVECPFCNEVFGENCDYVDVDVGEVQCSPNYCDACGAYEIGGIQYDDLDAGEKKVGWRRGSHFIEFVSGASRVVLPLWVTSMSAPLKELVTEIGGSAMEVSRKDVGRILEALSDLQAACANQKVHPEAQGRLMLARAIVGRFEIGDATSLTLRYGDSASSH